jgi:hypothetical protein
MPVSFSELVVGHAYSRAELARIWGYAGIQALARGVVTPREDNKIILFVTGEKRNQDEQYEDELSGEILHSEGPNDHFAENRMVMAAGSNDEIHLFYRDRHEGDFTYHGRLELVKCDRYSDRPSKFTFRLVGRRQA